MYRRAHAQIFFLFLCGAALGRRRHNPKDRLAAPPKNKKRDAPAARAGSRRLEAAGGERPGLRLGKDRERRRRSASAMSPALEFDRGRVEVN